jgi:carbon storage regulator
MLVLTRKKNEILHIGQGILIKVIRVSGNKVRLGISAPRDLSVKRTELTVADAADVVTEPDAAQLDAA